MIAILLLAAVLSDAQGLAEHGHGWWIVKPVVTGAPCPECPGMLAPGLEPEPAPSEPMDLQIS